MIAATTTYAVISLLNLVNWITLILGALIYLTAYMITAPLIGAINKTDTQNLQEILKAPDHSQPYSPHHYTSPKN